MSLALSSDIADPTGPLLNLKELALSLRVSRQTLSIWIEKWPAFPIIRRGSTGVEYQFDAAAVFAFLRAQRDEQARSTAIRDQELAQLAFPFELEDQPPTARGATVKDQMEALKLRRMQREEAEVSRQLVPAREVADLLSTGLIQLNRDLHNAIRRAAREHNLPDPVARALDANLTEAQRRFVDDLAQQLDAAASEHPTDAP